jgi:Zn-dependent peptidase ImmA (M78 family)
MSIERPDYRRAEKAALDILKDYGAKAPPVDPIKIAKLLEVNVAFVKFSDEAERISGFYDFEENKICVNIDEFPLRQTFTIAHELGHTVLHKEWAKSSEYKVLLRDPDLQVTDAKEQEANAFAANLLMPRFMMDNYYSLPASDLSQLFAVSLPAVKARLSFLYGIS